MITMELEGLTSQIVQMYDDFYEGRNAPPEQHELDVLHNVMLHTIKEGLQCHYEEAQGILDDIMTLFS